jgi:exopolyphosphatase/guanosine-5'-triphosphate,3'-diphosphate pyrophosphatase
MAETDGQTALIGIGSNSTRLHIAERENNSVQVVERGEVVTRLAGYKVMADGRVMLTPDAIGATLEAAVGFARLANERGARLRGVIATEAVRAASNSEEVTEALERELGIPVRIISGAEEAALGWGAVASPALPYAAPDSPLGVIDIGGGSSDLSVGYSEHASPESVISIEMGGRTVMRRFGLDRHIERTKLMGTMAGLNVELGRRAASLRPKPETAVVIGGTASVLAALYKGAKSSASQGEDVLIDVTWLDEQLKEMSLLGVEGRVALGVPADRADIIVAGVAILLTILNIWGVMQCYVSERNILDGYLQYNL